MTAQDLITIIATLCTRIYVLTWHVIGHADLFGMVHRLLA